MVEGGKNVKKKKIKKRFALFMSSNGCPWSHGTVVREVAYAARGPGSIPSFFKFFSAWGKSPLGMTENLPI